MNYLYTDTIYGKPTEDELRTAKADAAIMADAGYDPETTTKITMTPELRNHLDIHRLKMAISEIEAGNQQRLKFLEDEKEVKAERDPPPINESMAGVNPANVWTIYRSEDNGKKTLYGGANHRIFAPSGSDDRARQNDGRSAA